VVTWPNPAAITYGAALGSVQLNASANMGGSFAYTPPAGTVLATGTNILTVIFTPSSNGGSTTNSVDLVVLPASLVVTANNATRQYGVTNPVFTGTITGLQNGDNITANYGCSATTTTMPGNYPIVPSLVDPNNCRTNYSVSLNDGTLTISMAVPLPPASLHVTSP